MATEGVLKEEGAVFHGSSGAFLEEALERIASLWREDRLVVYLGPDIYAESPGYPVTEGALATLLAERVAVPGRLKGKVHEIAQYIESHKHRRTLLSLVEEIFRPGTPPAPVHRILKEHPLGLVVDSWYGSASTETLVEPGGIQISGVSRAEYRDRWYRIDRRTEDGWVPVEGASPEDRVLYRPLGTRIPGTELLLSDADFVEVLTEIDIQTPIPAWVQEHRTGRHILLIECRFANQTSRIFARQIMKRSGMDHFAVMAGAPTGKERIFFEREGITVLPVPLNEVFLPELLVRLRKR
jgi:hypothetical protein